jgi:hypothetical protein
MVSSVPTASPSLAGMAHGHRVGGQWKIAELVLNSMKPLPGMPAAQHH